jgi:uncharacterized protein (DUF1501 family)
MLDADISTADALRHLSVDEPDDRLTIDRRRFLQLVGMGLGAGLVAGGSNSLLDELLLGHDPSAWAAGPVGANDGILVIIGMYGGNDGLNTVVPITDGLYYEQHGALAIPAEQTLPIDPWTGLHPNLTALKDFWDRGQLAIVEGVNYPNPDLSHFNSMAYWMSGQTSGIPMSGWVGRWLDGYLAGGPDLYAAAEIGSSLPLHMIGLNRRATTVPRGRPSFGSSTQPLDERMYAAMRSMRTGAHGPWHGAVGQALVDQLDLAAMLAPEYPAEGTENEIADRLEMAARLINANLGFRVLTAGWGDFDSHAGQPNMHPARMAELNEAITRFFAALDPAWTHRVAVMTFSEFGRTSWDNDGAGTDHGTSAPHFVFGANVRGGRYGQRPGLQGLRRWDRMPFHVDFRSYYASVIDGWMGGGSSSVFGGNFEQLPLFTRQAGVLPSGATAPLPAQVSAPSMFTPVTPFRILDTRDGTGGVIARAMEPGERIRVPVAGLGPIPAGGVTAVVANVTATQSSQPHFFTVYPGSTAQPGTSNLNAGPGVTVPNLVVMGVGPDGHIEVYNSHGWAHCLVDVFGYCTAGGGDRLTPLPPQRLFDTRTGQGVRAGKIVSQQPVDVQVAGQAGVPPTGATAVVLNMAVVEPEAPGWVRAQPAGATDITTSNLNYAPGDVVPNLVICKLGDGGRITIDSFGRAVHVLGDVFGYFGAGGSAIRTVAPKRMLDTRIGIGAELAPVGPEESIRLSIGGLSTFPRDATAVVLNVTATNVQGPTFVTVWPDGEDQPDTSNLNVVSGQTRANLVICRLGSNGALRFASPVSPCDLIADVLGYCVA